MNKRFRVWLTANRRWSEQSVVDAQQEEQEHLPGFPHHGYRFSCQLLDRSENLLAKPDVVQTVLFRPAGTQTQNVSENNQKTVWKSSIVQPKAAGTKYGDKKKGAFRLI